MKARIARGHETLVPVAAVLAILLVAGFLPATSVSEAVGVATPDSPPISDSQLQDARDILRSTGSYFIENRGQLPPEVLYYSRGNPSVAFREDGVMFVVRGHVGGSPQTFGRETFENQGEVQASISAYAYMLTFGGSNRARPMGGGLLSSKSNFLIGSDPGAWRSDVPNYREITYANLYDGIDLTYRIEPVGLKYEFTVRPGANPESIEMEFHGVDSLQVEADAVSVGTPIGIIRDSPPIAFQGTSEVACGIALRDELTYGFDCSPHDTARELVIDPLIYSTYLGGSDSDEAFSIGVDPPGNAYVAGRTLSANFPVNIGAFDFSYNGLYDVFVSKLNQNGSALVYSTYLGGSENDQGYSIGVDSSGAAYVSGDTMSGDFPVTPGAFDTTFSGDWDAFVTKLNPSGGSLAYSTYLGGGCHSLAYAVAVDSSGRAHVTGHTCSTSFPITSGAHQKTIGGVDDIFVLELNAAGSSLLFSTFLGGTSYEQGYGVASDSSGYTYVTGYTVSGEYPTTPSAYDASLNGAEDVVVSVVDDKGGLVYSTFIGGSGFDLGWAIALGPSGTILVAGWTRSSDFPVTPGAVDETYNGGDAFVTNLNPSTSTLTFSTFLGGGGPDYAHSVAVDSAGSTYVVGGTQSTDFPVTAGAFDTTYGAPSDFYLAELDSSGSSLLYSTFLGGDDDDFDGASYPAVSTSILPGGATFVAGVTSSILFPVTPGAYQTSSSGGTFDSFVMKFSWLPDLSILPPDIEFSPPSPVPEDTPVTVTATVHNIGGAPANPNIVRFYDGMPTGSNQIGADQPLGDILPGGSQQVSVTWTAAPPGFHGICAFVDPDNTLAEDSETNNLACSQMIVLGPPDYTVVRTNPAAFVTVGLSRPQTFSAYVSNFLGITPNVTVTLAFYDDLSPSSPFALIPVPPVAAGIDQGPYSGMWTSPPSPALRRITAFVDYYDILAESNENNNTYTWMVNVVPGPVSTLSIGSPKYVSTDTYITFSTPLSFNVKDNSGIGIKYTKYRLDGLSWIVSSGSFTLSGEGIHSVEWYSEDNAGNVENVSSGSLIVDNSPPSLTAKAGTPSYVSVDTWINSNTLIQLTAVDQGVLPVGLRELEYRTWHGTWSSLKSYSVPFNLTGEGRHYIEYSATDLLGNLASDNVSFIVDDAPPVTSIAVGYPHYQGVQMYVTSATLINLSSVDGGIEAVGIAFLRFGVDGAGLTDFTEEFNLTEEGVHTIEYQSGDLLGNNESVRSTLIVVDNTPPFTTYLVGNPIYEATSTYVTSSTPITLHAIDGGLIPVGLNGTRMRIWNGAWISWKDYQGSFRVNGPDGLRYMEFRSIDHLDNLEAVQNLTLIIDDTPPDVAIRPGGSTVDVGTAFNLSADDGAGCGVAWINYSVDSGQWSVYSSPFVLEAGLHIITVRTWDHLGNMAELSHEVTIQSETTPDIETDFNYKPVVALVFSIVLTLAGAFSARRRPLRMGTGLRRRLLLTWTILAVPFIGAEVVTGLLSLWIVELRIPPLTSWGTVIDCAILAVGLIIEVAFAARKERVQPEASQSPPPP